MWQKRNSISSILNAPAYVPDHFKNMEGDPEGPPLVDAPSGDCGRGPQVRRLSKCCLREIHLYGTSTVMRVGSPSPSAKMPALPRSCTLSPQPASPKNRPARYNARCRVPRSPRRTSGGGAQPRSVSTEPEPWMNSARPATGS